MLPPSATRTSCSFTQADLTPRKVWAARSTPILTASSKLVSDVALISVTRATEPAMSYLPESRRYGGPFPTLRVEPYPFTAAGRRPLPGRRAGAQAAGARRRLVRTHPASLDR